VKLQVVDNILCDSNFHECERTLGASLKGLKLGQDMLPMLMEQLVSMKLSIGPYFQPLLISRPSTPSIAVTSINVDACPICIELFYFNDICVASCIHTYHPRCLVVHTISSRKCRFIEVFHEGWCSSFGLLKPMVEAFGLATNLEGTRDSLTQQQTPSSQIIQIGMKSRTIIQFHW
jgi:hypothetical protein